MPAPAASRAGPLLPSLGRPFPVHFSVSCSMIQDVPQGSSPRKNTHVRATPGPGLRRPAEAG
eukprot:379150-Pyramimonas_sp.AAC.1